MIRLHQITQYADGGSVITLVEGSCLSTDEKPTDGIANGSVMVEVDTGDVYLFDEEASDWVEQFSFQS